MWVGLLFLVLGLGLGAGAFVAFVRTRTFLATAYTTQGEVLALEAYQDKGGGTLYRPVLRFRTHAGQETEFRSPEGSSAPGFQVGQRIDVVYNPEEPSDARIQGFMQLWLPTLILGTLGGIFVLVGALLTAVQLSR
jgi:hypothetical protein